LVVFHYITIGGYSHNWWLFIIELQSVKLANGSVLSLDISAKPQYVCIIKFVSITKKLRLIGAKDINELDSTQGSTGNPSLLSCEAGNNATNIFKTNLNIHVYQYHQCFWIVILLNLN
jgi:hypothetical protein